MATGLITAYANTVLDALTTAFPYMKLHTADPGAAATTAPAGNTTRQQVTWASATGGVKSNSAQIQWTGVSTSEDYTHYSLWSASTAGTCGHTGTITANPVTAGDTITFATGDFDITAAVAS